MEGLGDASGVVATGHVLPTRLGVPIGAHVTAAPLLASKGP